MVLYIPENQRLEPKNWRFVDVKASWFKRWDSLSDITRITPFISIHPPKKGVYIHAYIPKTS